MEVKKIGGKYRYSMKFEDSFFEIKKIVITKNIRFKKRRMIIRIIKLTKKKKSGAYECKQTTVRSIQKVSVVFHFSTKQNTNIDFSTKMMNLEFNFLKEKKRKELLWLPYTTLE